MLTDRHVGARRARAAVYSWRKRELVVVVRNAIVAGQSLTWSDGTAAAK
jgi:hypothetical protein